MHEQANCLPSLFYSKFHIGEKLFAKYTKKSYIVIDKCPNKLPCALADLVKDHVFVSSMIDGRIFLNRNCALCHGVNASLEWKLTVLNCPTFFLADITTLERVVPAECFLKLTPPPVLEKMVLQYECVEDRDIISTCNKSTGLEPCQRPSFWNRHAFYVFQTKIYTSYDCMKCNAFEMPPSELCNEIEEMGIKTPLKFISFSALLDLDIFKKEKERIAGCQGHQIYDPFLVSRIKKSSSFMQHTSIKSKYCLH